MQRIADLEVGAKIRFGRYSVEDEEAHEIRWIKVHNDNTFLTEYIEDFRAFDAREPSSPSRASQNYGNQLYHLSNIAQFLNSTYESWYQPTHEYDEPPINDLLSQRGEYKNHIGFLALFTDGEIEAIENSEVKTNTPNAEFELLEQKVFLPSVTNVRGDTVGDTNEGEYWDYFKTRELMGVLPTIEAQTYTKTGMRNYNDKWHWWLRSRLVVNDGCVHAVREDGRVSYCYAGCGKLGVRPALKLNSDILISDAPDDEGYYTLSIKDVAGIEISYDEFIDLLKS